MKLHITLHIVVHVRYFLHYEHVHGESASTLACKISLLLFQRKMRKDNCVTGKIG